MYSSATVKSKTEYMLHVRANGPKTMVLANLHANRALPPLVRVPSKLLAIETAVVSTQNARKRRSFSEIIAQTKHTSNRG